MTSTANPAQAGLLLAELLRSYPRYRQQWEAVAKRRSAQEITAAAVARVIARHLVDAELIPDTEEISYARSRLKDPLSRAFSGRMLRPELLHFCMDAFDMEPEHRERLQDLQRTTYISKFFDGTTDLSHELSFMSRDYETVAIHEIHYLGNDRSPSQHETVQVLRALTDGFSVYPYRFDTDQIRVTVKRGGRAGPIHLVQDGVWATDITLTKPLRRGDTASLTYMTDFHYPRPPQPTFRRAAVDRIDSLDIQVRFDPQCLPAHVWWATWPRIVDEGPPSHREPVALDKESAVHRYCESVKSVVVGFIWEW
jgi:hypothetical protein